MLPCCCLIFSSILYGVEFSILPLFRAKIARLGRFFPWCFFSHSINSIRSFIYLAQPWWLECYFSLLYWPTQGVLFNCSFQWHITPLNPILFSTVTCYFAFLQYNAGNPATALVIAAGKGLTDCIKCLLKAGADANISDEVSFIFLFSLL